MILHLTPADRERLRGLGVDPDQPLDPEAAALLQNIYDLKRRLRRAERTRWLYFEMGFTLALLVAILCRLAG